MRKLLLLLALMASSYLLTAQTTISGTVKDAKTKEPLSGASVTLKGTNQGTTTGNDGKFSIAIQKGDVVMIRYVGYAGQEIPSDNQSSWDIELTPSSGNLQEITIVGSRR